MKRVLWMLFLLLIVVFSFSACSEDEIIEVLFPEKFVTYSVNDDKEEFEKLMAGYGSWGIVVTVEEEGKYIFSMTKKQQREFLKRLEKYIETAVKELLTNGDPGFDNVEYLSIDAKADYSIINMVVREDQYEDEGSVMLGAAIVYMPSFSYQVLAGKGNDSRVTVNIYDENSNLLDIFVYPDMFFEDE